MPLPKSLAQAIEPRVDVHHILSIYILYHMLKLSEVNKFQIWISTTQLIKFYFWKIVKSVIVLYFNFYY